MRVAKKELGKLVSVKWYDAFELRCSREEAIKCPWVINKTRGLLIYAKGDRCVVETETSSEYGESQFTIIPYDWVEEITWE